jgi:thioredoxin 1
MKTMKSTLNKKDFKTEVLAHQGISIVQFKAEWSGACMMLDPIYEELKKSYSMEVRFYAVDVDAEPALAKEFMVLELPTMLFFRNGVLETKVSGLVPKNALIAKIENIIRQ